MTAQQQQQLEKAWPILEAIKNGKKVQWQGESGEWTGSGKNLWAIDLIMENPHRYRIAQEPKLRPWTPEEALGQKVRMKDRRIKHLWTITFTAEKGSFVGTTPGNHAGENLPSWYLTNCETIDGKPCGVEE